MMRMARLLTVVSLCCTASIMLPCHTALANESSANFLKQYCVDCHSIDDPSGEREFESLDLESTHLDTQIRLQEIIDQLTLGAMPPDDSDQPSVEARLTAINELTATLAHMREQTASTGGQTVLRRLSRREYRNTVGDLLGIDMTMFDPTIEFPADNLTHNADNIGDVLVTSGHLLEKYLDAADQCLEKAFAAREKVSPQEWTFKDYFFQQQELRTAHEAAFKHRFMVLYDHPRNDKPEGAYGALQKFREGVPADGWYEVKVRAEALHRNTPYDKRTAQIDLDEPFRLGIRPGDTRIEDLVHTQPIEPLLAETNVADNELRWYTFTVPLDRRFTPRFTFENGQHDVRGAYQRVFRNHKQTLPEQVRDGSGIVAFRNAVIKHGYLPQIRIHEVRIRGPLDIAPPQPEVDTLLSRRGFDAAKAAQQITAFASRAYRRPATDDEVANLVRLYQSRCEGGREPLDAYKDTLKAVLCSPSFLFLNPPDDAQQATLSDHALAGRLSYFLTSSMPDAELRALADRGSLSDPATIEDQTRRLLASDTCDRFVTDFLDSWLNLRALGTMPPDPDASRVYYAAGLESDMKQETRSFMKDLIDRNASVLEFLRADYSFVNRDLAKLYEVVEQVPADDASTFHRVVFEDGRRGGLLGQASVMTVSANGIETSPVIRGVWLLENILGTPTPPPPDEVPEFDPDIRGAKSIREQLDKHSESAACNQCHRKIDPLGFALECFDPIGRYRDSYDERGKVKIDTTAALPSGEAFSGPSGLRSVLLKQQEFFVRTVTTRLLSHALGRRIEASDRATIDTIVAQVCKTDYPLADLITAITTSAAFRRR